MILLVLGLILWIGAHFLKRLAPDLRARMGEAGKGGIALCLVLGLLAMIFGYRMSPFIYVWAPPEFLTHVNNLLMLIAFFVFGMSMTKGRLRGRMRHPQLIAVKIWALAHLLVNGDLASIVLFGGVLGWAVGEVILINRSEGWTRPAPGPASKDILLVVITLVTFSLAAGVHMALGVSPFGGA